jgi:hypothetical protein
VGCSMHWLKDIRTEDYGEVTEEIEDWDDMLWKEESILITQIEYTLQLHAYIFVSRYSVVAVLR